MLATSPMRTGQGLDMAQAMESAMVLGIGAIRSATMAFPMGPTGRRDSDGMADMAVLARHVRRLVRRAPGRPYLQIRRRVSGKPTE